MKPLNRWDCPGVYLIGDEVIWDGEAEYLGVEPLKTIPMPEEYWSPITRAVPIPEPPPVPQPEAPRQDPPPAPAEVATWAIKGFSVTLRRQITRAAAGQGITTAAWLHRYFQRHGIG